MIDVGKFYSVAITKNKQQADTGTKMIHMGKNQKHYHIKRNFCWRRTKYRGGVKILKNADNT